MKATLFLYSYAIQREHNSKPKLTLLLTHC